MNKISFIPQMRGFMAKMKEDGLPGNAVKLYMCLFDVFNKTCWKKEWVRISVYSLKLCFGSSSSSILYTNRKLLEDLGYIQVRSGYDTHKRYTEFKLINLYDENDASTLVPHTGTTPSTNPGLVPYAGTTSGTRCGTTYGTTSPSDPLCSVAPPLPKNKEEEKEVPSVPSIPDTIGIHSKGNKDAQADGSAQQSYEVFSICFGREPSVQEKLQLMTFLRTYGSDKVEAAILAMADAGTAYSQSQCLRQIQRQVYGIASPAPRRREPVPGWGGFRPA